VEIRDVPTAQHEAAHVVVGVSLGMRLRRAALYTGWIDGDYASGYAWLTGGSRETCCLMLAAGVAWDRAVGNPAWWSAYDAREARALCSSRNGYDAMVRAAAALLGGMTAVHSRVTSALLERDIGHLDIVAICHGAEIDV
jgi:hypothetical protein